MATVGFLRLSGCTDTVTVVSIFPKTGLKKLKWSRCSLGRTRSKIPRQEERKNNR